MRMVRPDHPNPSDLVYPGRTVVITGAGGGIGGALADRMRREGAYVVGIDKIFDKRNNFGGRGVNFPGDITDPLGLQGIAEALDVAGKQVDFLILAAGIPQSKQGEVSERECSHITNVNVGGTKNSFEAFARILASHATVIIISSDLITAPPERITVPVYAKTKREVAEYARVLAEANPHMRIVTILPGSVDTKLLWTGKTPEDIQRIKKFADTPAHFARTLLTQVVPKTRDFSNGDMVRIDGELVEKVTTKPQKEWRSWMVL